MQSYWKVMIQLPTVEGWEGIQADEDGYTIYPILFTPLTQLILDVKVPPITEFACTKWYKRKFLADMDAYDHYATTYPITDLFFNDGTEEHPVAFMEPEYRVLFGRYHGSNPIHLTDTTVSPIVENGDTVWFLFEAIDMERFKLLGLTSNEDPPEASNPPLDFLRRLQKQLWTVLPRNPDLRRQLLIAGLQRILWSLLDAPHDWSLVLWITQVGLFMYPWDLADGIELDAFEEAVEKDITVITPASAFAVK
ncbi:MAG: hypothetical protein Q6361_03720 [Candidatus Hermodarchaeota archaeon]|nr:hypothetical protein [Candidatus Hermodarchaeota archaeon]